MKYYWVQVLYRHKETRAIFWVQIVQREHPFITYTVKRKEADENPIHYEELFNWKEISEEEYLLWEDLHGMFHNIDRRAEIAEEKRKLEIEHTMD